MIALHQSCAGRRIALRQSCAGRRIAPVNPVLGAGLFPVSPGFPASNFGSNAKGRMGKIKLFPTTEYTSKQASDPFSPSVNIDDGWIPVKKYIEEDLGVNTEREQTYWDEWDEAALRRIIQQQRKITEASKKLEMKKLYQVLVVIDDFADTPQLHKPHGALDTLFIRGRHMQVSTWVGSQKLRLISAAVRVNMQFLCCWRLRNQHELDAVVEELSALLPKEQLYRLCEQATREPYSFLFVYYLKPKNEMFHIRFEERFALEKDADGSGAQLPGQKLFASSTLINAKCENISCASGAQCCTSVAAVHPPVVRRTGESGRLGQRL